MKTPHKPRPTYLGDTDHLVYVLHHRRPRLVMGFVLWCTLAVGVALSGLWLGNCAFLGATACVVGALVQIARIQRLEAKLKEIGE